MSALDEQLEDLANHSLDNRNFIDVTSPGTPDTEFSVTHGLGYIPVGRVILRQDKSGSLYAGGTAWDTEKIYLKTSVADMALRLLIC